MEKSFLLTADPAFRPTALVLTLGCKVNQFESAAISRKMEEAGFVLVEKGEAADVVIINTCTVTHRADFEVRALIRRAYRANPMVRTVVTGCLAQVRPDEVAGLPGVYLVLGQSVKDEIPARLMEECSRKIDTPKLTRSTPILDLGCPSFDRSRAFFRIQDGCNQRCTYCIVPDSRGPSRSLPREKALAGIDEYYRAGREEIVLTGIHLGCWGLDLKPRLTFASLLAELSERQGARLRISSIEPNEVSEDILDLVRNSKRFCPHLHLPLQSGSDSILSAMHRPYTSGFFADLVRRAVQDRPDFCLGADVLVGFPGETDQDFEQTRGLLAEAPVSYLHVFPYSRRPSTPAALAPDQVPPETAKERVRILRKLGQGKRREFNLGCLGMRRPALIENTKDKTSGLNKALTDNYIPVLLPDPVPPAGTIAMVELTEPSRSGVMKGRLA